MRAGMDKRSGQPWYADALAALEEEQAGNFADRRADGRTSCSASCRSTSRATARPRPGTSTRSDRDAQRRHAEALQPRDLQHVRPARAPARHHARRRSSSPASDDFICGPVCADEISAAIPGLAEGDRRRRRAHGLRRAAAGLSRRGRGLPGLLTDAGLNIARRSRRTDSARDRGRDARHRRFVPARRPGGPPRRGPGGHRQRRRRSSSSSAWPRRRSRRRASACARRSATAACEFPQRRLTVNLAPAELRKEGSGLDLPIAVAIAPGARGQAAATAHRVPRRARARRGRAPRRRRAGRGALAAPARLSSGSSCPAPTRPRPRWSTASR